MPSPLPVPPLDVSALLAPKDAPTVQAGIVAALVGKGIRADRWPPEGVAMAATAVFSSVLAAAWNTTLLPAIKAGWLPFAARGWLTWLALYVYGVQRSQGTFATGTLTLTNGGGGSYALDPGEATFQNTTTKATYTNTDAIVLGPGPGTSQVIGIRAIVAGSGGNAGPGDITTIVTTMLGVTCTNATDVAGIDEQSDPSLQLLCWNSIAANSAYGPRQAVGYAIQTAKNAGAPVNVNRWQIAESSHTGQLAVYLASPSGPASPGDVAAVLASINSIARPPCVQPTVSTAAPVVVADALTVYVLGTPGLDAASVTIAVVDALVSLFADPDRNPIGGRYGGLAGYGLFASQIEAACLGAWPGVTNVEGAADHTLSDGQVATDGVTVTVVIV